MFYYASAKKCAVQDQCDSKSQGGHKTTQHISFHYASAKIHFFNWYDKYKTTVGWSDHRLIIWILPHLLIRFLPWNVRPCDDHHGVFWNVCRGGRGSWRISCVPHCQRTSSYGRTPPCDTSCGSPAMKTWKTAKRVKTRTIKAVL